MHLTNIQRPRKPELLAKTNSGSVYHKHDEAYKFDQWRRNEFKIFVVPLHFFGSTCTFW